MSLPTLSNQPARPLGKLYLVQCRGGSDKKADGNRGDTIPICNALIKQNWFCEPVFYSDAEYDKVCKVYANRTARPLPCHVLPRLAFWAGRAASKP